MAGTLSKSLNLEKLIMSTKIIKWKSTRNTELCAIKRHGSEWIVKRHDIDGKLLICPLNDPNSDLRWINPDQVLEARWEVESIYE